MHKDGCPTEFFGGLQKGALAVVGARSSDTVIFILSFTTGCRHVKDKDFGRLSGSARKTEKLEVSCDFIRDCCCLEFFA